MQAVYWIDATREDQRAREADARIGDRSVATLQPGVEGMQFEAVALNSNRERSAASFVICLAGPHDSDSAFDTIALAPSVIHLRRADGTRVRPDGYAADVPCGGYRGENYGASNTFASVADGARAEAHRVVDVYNNTTAGPFLGIALRFAIAPPDPRESITLELDRVWIDAVSYPIAPIPFVKGYGVDGAPARSVKDAGTDAERSAAMKPLMRWTERNRAANSSNLRFRLAGESGASAVALLLRQGFTCTTRVGQVYSTDTHALIDAFAVSCRSAVADNNYCEEHEARLGRDNSGRFSDVASYEEAFRAKVLKLPDITWHCHRWKVDWREVPSMAEK